MRSREAEPILKAVLSSDRRLQLAYVKMELLVNAGQLYCVEYVPGPCTPPVTSWELATPEAGILTVRREPSRVGSVTGTKS